MLVLWTEDRGRNRGEEGGEGKRETGRGELALEGGCFPDCCIWRTEEESIIWDHLDRTARLHRSIDSTSPSRDRGVAMKRPHDYSSPDSDTEELIDVGQEDSYWWGPGVYNVLSGDDTGVSLHVELRLQLRKYIRDIYDEFKFYLKFPSDISLRCQNCSFDGQNARCFFESCMFDYTWAFRVYHALCCS